MLHTCSKKESTISIGQMAKTFQISRQTLIHYDHIDLFKPSFLDEHGYRFYCACQIPTLREITFLKRMGMKLEMIKKIIEECDPYDFMKYLSTQKKILDEEIARLTQYQHLLNDRLSLFSQLKEKDIKINEPFIENHPQREYIFEPFETEEIIHHELIDLTFMNLWDQSVQLGSYHLHGYGVLLKASNFSQENQFKDAGVFIFLDASDIKPQTCQTLKAGKYLSMFKYGMPYDLEALTYLMGWASKHGYEIDGDILDLCIYKRNDENDFCLLQMPIKNE